MAPSNGNLCYPLVGVRGGRLRLVQLFAELGYKEGVEVGTSIGKFAQYMLQTIPNLHLTCVDPYIVYNEAPQERQDNAYERVQKNLAGLNATILRRTSMDAVRDFKDGSLDFVYMDGNHEFDYAMSDLINWTPKVRIGGIMSGHDYIYVPSVTRAVDVYVQNHFSIGPYYLVREPMDGGAIGGGGSFFWVQK
jgi:predicted O-methyltransferase YrrM